MLTKKSKIVVAKVISDKMNKTRIVAVVRKDKDSLYNKIINKTTKYSVHDETNLSKEGDIVEMAYFRPLSANKSWTIIKVLEKATL